MNDLDKVLEGLLFLSGDGLDRGTIMEKLQITPKALDKAIEVLKKRYDENCGINFITYKDKLQLCGNPKYADDVSLVLNPIRERQLSRATLEVMAIIAYKQPVTRLDVQDIRGLNSDYAIQTLLNYKLIEVVGRKDAIGKPLLFGTTDEFLRHFGINDIKDLPNYDDLMKGIQQIQNENNHLYNEFEIPDDDESQDNKSADNQQDNKTDDKGAQTDLDKQTSDSEKPAEANENDDVKVSSDAEKLEDGSTNVVANNAEKEASKKIRKGNNSKEKPAEKELENEPKVFDKVELEEEVTNKASEGRTIAEENKTEIEENVTEIKEVEVSNEPEQTIVNDNSKNEYKADTILTQNENIESLKTDDLKDDKEVSEDTPLDELTGEADEENERLSSGIDYSLLEDNPDIDF